MTTVNTTTTPTSTPGTSPSHPAFTVFSRIIRDRIAPKVDPLARQQAIENALSTALHYLRTDSSPASIQRATGRAIRAASMLKQACTELSGVTA